MSRPEGIFSRLPRVFLPPAARCGYDVFSRRHTPTRTPAGPAGEPAQVEVFRGQKRAAGQPEPQVQALVGFCQALLSANRFLYID